MFLTLEENLKSLFYIVCIEMPFCSQKCMVDLLLQKLMIEMSVTHSISSKLFWYFHL